MSDQRTMRIAYCLNEAGRRASLLAGGNGKELQISEVPLSAALLELAAVREDGSAWIYVTSMRGTHRGQCGEPLNLTSRYPGLLKAYKLSHDGVAVFSEEVEAIDVPPTDVAEWVLGIPWDNQQRENVLRAKADENLRRKHEEWEAFAAVRAAQIATWLADPSLPGESGWGEVKLQASNGWVTIAQPSADLVAEVKRREAERKECERLRREAEEKVKAAEAAAYYENCAKWVRAHGSERLRKALEMGLLDSSMTVYREERMALEFPGWRRDCRHTHHEGEIRNPSLKALELLERVRKDLPEAELVTVREDYEEDDEPTEWREAVRVDDLPGIKSDKVFYLLVDES